MVEPGQDIVYEYRWQQADGTWSSWRRTPDTGELDYPNEAREIQHRIAVEPRLSPLARIRGTREIERARRDNVASFR